jgi:hypothetical protein
MMHLVQPFALGSVKINPHRAVLVRVAVPGDVNPLVIIGYTRTLRTWVYSQLHLKVLGLN